MEFTQNNNNIVDSHNNTINPEPETISEIEEIERKPDIKAVEEEKEGEDEEEDRIRWLRERGVIIEIPHKQSKTKAKTSSSSSSSSSSATESDGVERRMDLPSDITIVKIPFDTRLPYEEHTITIDLSQPGDQLLSLLSSSFSSDGSDINRELLREMASKQFGTNQGSQVSEETLNMLASRGTVEAFPLVVPCASNLNVGVTAYLDETGVLKGLPLNTRASSIAGLCGFEGLQLRGDVFIARLEVVRLTGIRNASFLLSDLASSSPWIKEAASINYQRGLETNRVAMGNTESQAEIEAAKEKEEQGFKWSQTPSTVDIVVALPAGVGSKNIAVKFTAKTVLVTLKASGEQLLSLDLLKLISTSDSTWACTTNKGVVSLEITAEKCEEGLWSSLTNIASALIDALYTPYNKH